MTMKNYINLYGSNLSENFEESIKIENLNLMCIVNVNFETGDNVSCKCSDLNFETKMCEEHKDSTEIKNKNKIIIYF